MQSAETVIQRVVRRALLTPGLAPVVRELRTTKRELWSLYRLFRGRSHTYWDRQDPKYQRNGFLRDRVDGVSHPSRVYIRQWLKNNPGLTLLDIPCGPGVELEGLLAESVPVSYLGMDFSETMLETIRERFPQANVRKGDILEIPLPDRSVDVVLCRHILEHLNDWRPAVREALRVATICVFIVLFRSPTHNERHSLGHGAWDNRLDQDELRAFLQSARPGIRVEMVTLPFPYEVPPLIEENVVFRVDCGGTLLVRPIV